jgi:hypothetical protein
VGDDRNVTLSTCNVSTNFDTVIVVYEERAGCITCYCADFLIYNDDAPSQICSTLSFLSVNNRVYLIFVGGIDTSQYGNFVLSITRTNANSPSSSPSLAPAQFVAPATAMVPVFVGSPPTSAIGSGYSCVDSIPLTLDTPVIRYLSSTTAALKIGCSDEPFPKEGYWFRFIGPELPGTFTVHTCEPLPSTYAYSSLVVYDFAVSGLSSCVTPSQYYNLVCSESSRSTVSSSCAAVQFTTTTSFETRYIYATSWATPTYSRCSGSCAITVRVTNQTSYALAPSSSSGSVSTFSVCSQDVTSASYGTTYTKTFGEFATRFPSSDLSCGILNTTYGVWYTTKGDTRDLTMTTCFDETTAGTVIAVFRGSSCGSLTCVATTSDYLGSSYSSRSSTCTRPGRSSLVLTSSTSSDTLYIFVAKATPEYNTFVLSGDSVTFQIVSERASRDLALGLGLGLGVPGFFIFFIGLALCLSFCSRRGSAAAPTVVAYNNTATVTAYATPAPVPVGYVQQTTTTSTTTTAPVYATPVQQMPPGQYPQNSVQMNTYYS